MPPILETQGLYKSYQKDSQKIEVLKGIDLSVDAGDQIVLLGSSGAGKSTLLHLLGGLDRPDQGEVFFRGENLFQKSEEDLALFRNRHLGFVFQFHHLLPLFNALENVMMPHLIAKTPRSQAKEKSLESLSAVGLSHRANHRPQELSGGEQQRVALARALTLKPEILMADEPTGNLDTETSQKVLDLFLDLSRGLNTTLVVVTHNEEMARHFQRKIRVQDGKIAQIG